MTSGVATQDLALLEHWLDDHGIGSGPLTLEPLGDGHSNPTFTLTRGTGKWVLRRAPFGPLAPSTHDVLREAAWMQALHPAGIRVPVVVAECADNEVAGSPFFVMELLEGFVPSESLPPEVDDPAGREAVAGAFVDALAELHAVPVDLPALERFRRPGSYIDRQLKRFTELWAKNQTRPMPDIDAVTTWLHEHRPAAGGEGVVHGDARPGNAVFLAGDGGVDLVGLLDWEMAAIGDPLADVGYLLATWAEPGDPDDPLLEVSRLTREPGFPTRAQLAERYAQRTGQAVGDLRFYEVLALWKAVIVMEGNYRRYVERTADNPFFATYAEGLPRIAARASALTRTT